jgi:hypothetical protein
MPLISKKRFIIGTSYVGPLTNSPMHPAASRGGVDVSIRGGRTGGGAMGEEAMNGRLDSQSHQGEDWCFEM